MLISQIPRDLNSTDEVCILHYVMCDWNLVNPIDKCTVMMELRQDEEYMNI